jgi:DNA polymerase I-like protein with 3'-5' exonuclease and polymerase domains
MSMCDKDMVKVINFVHKQIGYLCLKMLEDGVFIDYNMLSYLNNRIVEKKTDADKKAKYFLDKIFNARGIEKKASEVNFNSAKQMVKVFFHDLGLPVFEKSAKTNEPSTGVDSLLLLIPFEPSLILCELLSHKWGTYLGYLKNYLEVVGKSKSGLPICCHSYFNPTGTVTGRLASSKPNAQNITGEAQLKSAFCSPDRSELIYNIREKMKEHKKGINNETDLQFL